MQLLPQDKVHHRHSVGLCCDSQHQVPLTGLYIARVVGGIFVHTCDMHGVGDRGENHRAATVEFTGVVAAVFERDSCNARQ